MYLLPNPHSVLAVANIPTTNSTMKIHELSSSLPTSFKVEQLSADSKWGRTNTGHIVSVTNVTNSVASGCLKYEAAKDSYTVLKHSFLSQQGILLFSETKGSINPTF